MGVEIAAGMAIAGAITGAGGSYVQYQGAQKQAGASARAEELRKQQMELESQRKQRQLIREAQKAQATALVRTTAQGSSQQSSALGGSYGQIASDLASNLTYENKALNIGRGIFDANAAYANAGATTALGGAISSIGSALIKTSTIGGNIGETLFNGKNTQYSGKGGASDPWWTATTLFGA